MASFIQDIFEIYEAKRKTRSYQIKEALCFLIFVGIAFCVSGCAIVGLLYLLGIIHK